MEFVYESLDESSKFCLVLNWKTRSFKTLHAFALKLHMKPLKVKNIQLKHNAYFPVDQYNKLSRAYFYDEQDVINCMNELNSILINNLLRGDYNV